MCKHIEMWWKKEKKFRIENEKQKVNRIDMVMTGF